MGSARSTGQTLGFFEFSICKQQSWAMLPVPQPEAIAVFLHAPKLSTTSWSDHLRPLTSERIANAN